MKTLKFIILTFVLAIISLNTNAQKNKMLEISFDYVKQKGPGSNQYGIWIENDKGEVIRTLSVTSFTTRGRMHENDRPARGYTYRPTCVQTWVKHVNADKLSDKQIDGISCATPMESGTQIFTWNFKNHYHKYVPAGTYKIYLEATYFNDALVTYIGTFSTDDMGNITLNQTYTKPEVSEHKDMIQNVKATIKDIKEYINK